MFKKVLIAMSYFACRCFGFFSIEHRNQIRFFRRRTAKKFERLDYICRFGSYRLEQIVPQTVRICKKLKYIYLKLGYLFPFI